MADGLFSKPLLQAMQATFQAGEQSILFLNRRGFSPLVLCRACGHVLRCTQCAVAMTYHQARALLACHYCGREEPVPRLCPSCHAPKLERLGTGTERVETLVREHFPTARVARLDRDSAGGRGGAVLERVLGQVHARAIDILVGTQMVTKGHDFEGVTLVGVLLPDQGMHMPDFRAAERTFQLLEQVAGRAGRGERPGRVLVQTYTPEHPAVAALPAHDYEGFARAELARRREAGYPPFTRLIALRLEGGEGTDVRQAAGQAAARARAAGGEAGAGQGTGRGSHRRDPGPAPLAGVAGRDRPDRAGRGGAGGRGGQRRRACGWWSTSTRRACFDRSDARLGHRRGSERHPGCRAGGCRAGRRRRAVGTPAPFGQPERRGVRLVAGPPVYRRRHRAAVDRRRRPGEDPSFWTAGGWCWPAAAATRIAWASSWCGRGG